MRKRNLVIRPRSAATRHRQPLVPITANSQFDTNQIVRFEYVKSQTRNKICVKKT